MAKVLGIGNALVDIITQIDDDTILEGFGLPKGSMTLVDRDTSNFIHAETAGLPKAKASGGSAANTIHGLAHLGIETGFIGAVGNDELGRFFKKDMQANKINPILFKSMQDTGRAMALISKDTERTFATHLGAAINLSVDDITKDVFEGYDYCYLEGYLVQNPEMMEKALRLARNEGLIVCIDLASYNIVAENRDFFNKLITNYVDIVFANEDEVTSLTGLSPEQSAKALQKQTRIVVVKLGAEGSLCASNEGILRIGVRPSKPIDTTGAGDLYAAGFLYGLVKGHELKMCGKIGAMLAGRVIEFVGAKMEEPHWENLRREIAAMEG